MKVKIEWLEHTVFYGNLSVIPQEGELVEWAQPHPPGNDPNELEEFVVVSVKYRIARDEVQYGQQVTAFVKLSAVV